VTLKMARPQPSGTLAYVAVVSKQPGRARLGIADYARRSQVDPCFLCKIVEGTHDFPHGEIYRDGFAVAFLNRFPTLLGYTLVAPIEHRVSVVDGFTEAEHLRIQALVHRVGRAIAHTLPTEHDELAGRIRTSLS
jgi:hypothetical protein